MSQPRVTVTLGRGGQRVQRHVTVPTEMYADRASGDRSRKRSIRDRLGSDLEPIRSAPQPNKRPREVDGQWKHDLFYDDREEHQQDRAGRNGTQDLRTKLARQPPKGGFQGRGSGVVDLREKLSGSVSHPPPLSQVNDAAKRRVASVVYNSSNVTQGVASTTVPAPVQARQKPTAKANVDGDAQTVRSLLQSLGLEKYWITFQAEEVDMAVLRHMSDTDLKELGVPMGPRKKILLAMRGGQG